MAETTKVKEFFVKRFNKKLLIMKAIIAFFALIVVLALSLSFYFWLKDKPADQPYGPINGFWYIYVTWNNGIGWSALENNYAAIYGIQSVVCILLITVFLLVTHDKITCSFVALAIFGGFFNLIQRAASSNNAVLDYFRFGFWPSFPIFNWPDMFVVIGIFGFVISFIIVTIIQYKKEDQKEKQNAKQ